MLILILEKDREVDSVVLGARVVLEHWVAMAVPEGTDLLATVAEPVAVHWKSLPAEGFK
jgi:hypothetical protein